MKHAVKQFLRLPLVDPEVSYDRVVQSAEVMELAAEIQHKYEEDRNFELQWRANQNYLQGNQYCDILAEGGELVDYPAMTEYEQRGVYNQIAPIYETRLSKLSRVLAGFCAMRMENRFMKAISVCLSCLHTRFSRPADINRR